MTFAIDVFNLGYLIITIRKDYFILAGNVYHLFAILPMIARNNSKSHHKRRKK